MRLFSRKFKEPIRGTATVAASTACPSHASSASCRMDLVISLPGVPATPTTRTMMVRADKWPYPGTVLPIEVDAAKPSRLRVLWDEVPSGRSRGITAAQQLADQMNGGAGAAAGTWHANETWVQGGGPIAGGPSTAGTPTPGALLGGFPIPPGARVVSSSTTINGQPASADQIAAIESLTGMDLNGDGIVGPSRGVPNS